ncbi:MAG TPA: hypothetical protein PKD96_02120 [Candidatus Absconditabacterales bacterium]|nr:hypothetical protein [Candidatus Absconditabacterales bacterium]HMT27076.1 hypothetical protein [Candidatus Absconditabacterales bacterium]
MTFYSLDSQERKTSNAVLEKDVSQETTQALEAHKDDVVKMAGIVGAAFLADSFSDSKPEEKLSWKEKLKKQFSREKKNTEIVDKNTEKVVEKKEESLAEKKIVSAEKKNSSDDKENFKDFEAIESSGILYQNGCTMCSRTARLDAKSIFGVDLPSGNARDSFSNPILDKGFLGTAKDFSQDSGNFADVLVEPPKMKFSEYGHRFIAFRNQRDGQWYGIDPYVQHRQVKPFLIKDYFWRDRIIKVNYYDSPIKIS